MSKYVGKFFTAVSAALEFNTATLSGAMDILVIESPDGIRQSTPFHVRFGKLQLLKTRGIPISVDVNNQRTQLRMLLGAAGEAYFYNPPPDSPLNSPVTSPPLLSSKDTSLSFPNANIRADTDSENVSSSQLLPSCADLNPAANPSPLLEPSLDRTQLMVTNTPRKHHSCDSTFHIQYASDTEVELTRAVRDGDTEIIDEPRSPPLPTPCRKLAPSALATPSASAPALLVDGGAARNNLPPSKDESLLSNEEGIDADCSALFDLPSTPQCSVPQQPITELSEAQVAVPTMFADVDGEEDRKLDIRSLDGYDADDDDIHPHSLQQHVSRVLASSAQLALPSSSGVITDDIDVASPDPSECDPPSDRDDLLIMSLCGNLIAPEMQEDNIVELFERHRLSFNDISSNPNVVFDPNILFRVDNRIVDFRVAAPFLCAALAFNRRLDIDTLSRLTRPEEELPRSSEAQQSESQPLKQQKEPPKSPPTPRRFRWFGWSSPPVVGEPLLQEEEVHALDAKKNETQPQEEVSNGPSTGPQANEKAGQTTVTESTDEPKSITMDNTDEKEQHSGDEVVIATGPSEAKSDEEPMTAMAGMEVKTKVNNEENSEQNSGKVPLLIGEKQDDQSQLQPLLFSDVNPEHLSLQPTTEQLISLPLKPGANSLRFYVDETTVELDCRIFLWSCHSKIVISDVDGTITRSDVLGHLLPAVGRDWSHVGVAGLYTHIERNGYKMLYLTARPIGQASQTRTFLQNVTQGNAKLPDGPVLMSPNRLMESFAREVIRRKPHEFKIAALREVRSLFPPEFNPFHAGFGNRDTDVISYRAVGLIPQRIFTVNPQGELAVMKAKYESAASYITLKDLVDNIFPDIAGMGGQKKIQALAENATYNDWNYWRSTLPELNFDELLKK